MYHYDTGEVYQNGAFATDSLGIPVISNGNLYGDVTWTGMYINRSYTGDTTSKAMISFARDSVFSGDISASTTAVSYNTYSDYRLKDVLGEITNASTRVLGLNPIRFSWKSTGEEVDGFLAHEAQEVVPEAVTGLKDAVKEDGTPQYQSIDQSKLVPLLVAALQDALKRIAVLEAK